MQQQQLGQPTKYELYIYLSKNRDEPDYQEWATRYNEKVQQHNSKILNGESTLDSGFDLFMPNNGIDYGYGVDILVTMPAAESSVSSLGADGARALNMRVKCCMRENVVSHLSTSLLSSGPNDSPDPKIITTQLTKPARGYYLYPRSSISKTRMRIANSVGIIDSGYRGDIIAAVDTIGVFGSSDIWHVWKETLMPIKKYDRYFQICAPDLSPFVVYIVEDEAGLGEPTLRGAGGFGSTGT